MGSYGNEYEFEAANTPGGRYSAVSWTDRAARLWLFGGGGFSFGGYYLGVTGIAGELNDLWVFDLSQGPHGEWAWMGGSSELPQTEACTTGESCGVSGAYGTEYEASAESMPGGRHQAVSWANPDGRIWLFGGVGFDSTGDWGSLNDLWVFDPAKGTHGEWAWMGGSAILPQRPGCTGAESDDCGVSGIYGEEYQFAPKNSPGGRFSPISWTGRDSRIWLFGGAGLDSAGNWGSLNDLWAFDPAKGTHGEWAWMGGSNVEGQPGEYGTEYRFSEVGVPGGRESVASWKGQDGSFWLFGGFSAPNDLWEYKIGAQSITFPQPASPVIYSAKHIALTATASSGLAVRFASTTPKVCTVASAEATLLAAGSCSIEATQPGDGDYSAAAPVKRTIIVKPAGTVAKPVIEPGTGTYAGKQTVSITDSTAKATIYYTTDGSTPSATHGTQYRAAFSVNKPETVKAIAAKRGYTDSAVAAATYTIE
jgi:hypothetical protein